jgi:hypothetical protein
MMGPGEEERKGKMRDPRGLVLRGSESPSLVLLEWTDPTHPSRGLVTRGFTKSFRVSVGSRPF